MELHDVQPGRPNIYAKFEGCGPRKRLDFNGHTDTVPVVSGWTHDPFAPVKEDGKIYGLGSNDMKGGIASILSMMKAFVDSGHDFFKGQLSFSGLIDEEAYGEGAKAMLKTDWGKVDGMVLAGPMSATKESPTPLIITGKVVYDIYVKGKAAHSFHPQAGIILANLPQERAPHQKDEYTLIDSLPPVTEKFIRMAAGFLE
jgi:acetylornithine deacetylase/succinyl-diaminopimelate desuccinylase-like protein